MSTPTIDIYLLMKSGFEKKITAVTSWARTDMTQYEDGDTWRDIIPPVNPNNNAPFAMADDGVDVAYTDGNPTPATFKARTSDDIMHIPPRYLEIKRTYYVFTLASGLTVETPVDRVESMSTDPATTP
jgi:hypothetical protein